jgi:uncharacterized membrane protein YhiD involved in acid resistance
MIRRQGLIRTTSDRVERALSSLSVVFLLALMTTAPSEGVWWSGSRVVAAQSPEAAQPSREAERRAEAFQERSESPEQFLMLREAIARLPLATALACVLALRPRRRAIRHASVVETQIILALVGAVVMLVVGTSLARAFGIVGAAGLVRYRARIGDPKDAGVMLSTLAIGLAAGVGLWMLAVFATFFILLVLWIIESFETTRQSLLLTVKAKNPIALKPKLEELLARARVEFVLRTESDEELSYQVEMPVERKTDRMTNAIFKLDANNAVAVEWEEKKSKN